MQPTEQSNPDTFNAVIQKGLILDMILRSVSTERTTRPPISMAYFPTIADNSIAKVEKLFVSEKPMSSYSENGEVINTVYNQLTVTEEHSFRGGIKTARTTMYVSQDLSDVESFNAARIMSLYGCEDKYLTFTSAGTISGGSYQLALIAACMGLPCKGVALTGEVEGFQDGGRPLLMASAGLLAKKAACHSAGLKLISVEGKASLPGYTPMIGSDTTDLTETLSGLSPNPYWAVMYITNVPEMVLAVTASYASSFLLAVEGTGDNKVTVFKPFDNKPQVVDVVTLAAMNDRIKYLTNLVQQGQSSALEYLDSLVSRDPTSANLTKMEMIKAEVRGAFAKPIMIEGHNFDYQSILMANGEYRLPKNSLENFYKALGTGVLETTGKFNGMGPYANTVARYKSFLIDLKTAGQAQPGSKKAKIPPQLQVSRRSWLQGQAEPSTSRQGQKRPAEDIDEFSQLQ